MPDDEKVQERQRQAAREAMDAPAADLDETVPGGRYKVGDELVDAEGKLLKGSKADKADKE